MDDMQKALMITATVETMQRMLDLKFFKNNKIETVERAILTAKEDFAKTTGYDYDTLDKQAVI